MLCNRINCNQGDSNVKNLFLYLLKVLDRINLEMLETSSFLMKKESKAYKTLELDFFYLDLQKTENDPKNGTCWVQIWTLYANIKKN